MNKPVLLIFGLVVTIVALAIIRTSIANNIVTSGVVLAQIQEQSDQYKLENSILYEKLYALSSLTNVAQKAYDLGYQDQASDFVLGKQTVALKQ